ncbi:unnamed protein product, partial [Acidithrix sp. C25]
VKISSLIPSLVKLIDSIQRKNKVASFMVAVYIKSSRDRVSSMAALFAYYALFAIIPLLILLVGLLGIFTTHNSSLKETVLNSALANFPIIGAQIKSNIHVLVIGTISSIVSVVTLASATKGLSSIAMRSMQDIWYVVPAERGGFAPQLGRKILWSLVIGIGSIASTTLAAYSSRFLIISILIAALINIAMFILATNICLPKSIGIRKIWRGAVAGAIVWQILQFFGSSIVSHQLSKASALYGFFGIVIGLLTWVYLISYVTLITAQIDVVFELKLWPRSLDRSNPTTADLAAQKLQNKANVIYTNQTLESTPAPKSINGR